MQAIFEAYLRALAITPLNEKTEHTDRAALQTLLQAVAEDAQPGATVLHEPRRDKGGAGSPDFKITRQGRIAGYVEVKQLDSNLSQILRSDQIKKYRTLSENLILTDYLEFCWIRPGEDVIRCRLAHSDQLTNRRPRLNPEAVEAVSLLLRGFMSATPARIGRGHDLALALASRGAFLRDFLAIELVRQAQTGETGRLHALFSVFREQIFHELTTAEFADAFAQMLAYGLFLARLNAGPAETVTLENVRRFIPGSFGLIRELVRFIEELGEPEYQDIRWVVDEILSIVNGIDLASVQADLSFRTRRAIYRDVRARDEEEHRLFERDPFIYFYEDFLKAYDPAMRKSRGVYYTPPPIVNFIIRSVDDILKRSFGIGDGLADHQRVTVLDFACGTGTFLLEAFQRIFENIGGAGSGRADLVVREHLTRNLFGFEYLVAPYTIAHLKLSQYLRDQGHVLGPQERFQVFLTNTVEPVAPQYDSYFPAVSREVEAAQRVKDRDILVIVGNPPYSGHSKNNGAWISRAIDGYKYTVERRADLASEDGRGLEQRVPLGERNSKWLNDDYVKFIRFAQLKMDAVPEGMVGVITNHSWLDNPTFRGMRQSLMRSFDQIHVLDLHGSTKRKERAPDGSTDENVFDILPGVAITIFVKRAGLERGVWRGDLWGRRLEKYRATAEGDLTQLVTTRLAPTSPSYLFVERDAVLGEEYEAGWAVAEIFGTSVLGFQTHRDDFAISFSPAEMGAKLHDLADQRVTEEDLKQKYGLKSNRDWSLTGARVAVRAGRAKPFSRVAYRPFDVRWSEFSDLTMDYPRRELLDHVAGRENLCLLVPRQIGTAEWRHAFIANIPADNCLIATDTKAANHVLPLWRFTAGTAASENLTPAFRTFLDTRYETLYSPEEILGFIYAILHAPAYRSRYAAFLRMDFPRIPFPENVDDFEELSSLGWALLRAHLLQDLPRVGLGLYHGRGDHRVEAPRYAPAEQAVWINPTQRFAPVPQAVWQFHIGGHQVFDKYLKSRKGRVLSLEEVNNLGMVADSLAFTLEQMTRIDTAYTAAFPGSG